MCGQVNILIALTDIGPGDGGTMVIPGSHKANFQHPHFEQHRMGPGQSVDGIEGSIEISMQAGDALLFDFGGRYQHFSADITRTFFIGQVSETDRAFYDTVLAANTKGREISKPGLTASAVDDAVCKVLEHSQFAAFKRHKTGHGLGLDVHEAPQIMRGNQQKLEPGMVFTIEPGLYRDGEAGVRIEDDVVVTETGVESLTTYPRDLRVIG